MSTMTTVACCLCLSSAGYYALMAVPVATQVLLQVEPCCMTVTLCGVRVRTLRW